MITLDGAMGEGGGQVLRTALALSVVTGEPFRIVNVRGGRVRPGLMRQHLTAVRAAAAVGRAAVEGDVPGSRELSFAPSGTVAGEHRFDVGSAGSTTLVLQTVLPPLLLAPEASTLILEGGTHNPGAPPFDFLGRVLLPLLRRMGPRVKAILDRPGFYPRGGGKVRVTLTPAPLIPLELLERGAVTRCRATAAVAGLPRSIAERELGVLRRRLGLAARDAAVAELDPRFGPGNVVTVDVESAGARELLTGFGAKGVRAETVAEGVAGEVERYLAAGVPVGAHLADQLLLPLALAGGGAFATLPLSSHALTVLEVIRRFLPVPVTVTATGPGVVVRVGAMLGAGSP